MPTVLLGNEQVGHAYYATPEDEVAGRKSFRELHKELGPVETVFAIPSGDSLVEALQTVIKTWPIEHSKAPPSWVESDNEALAQLLSEHWSIPVGRPKGWDGLTHGVGSYPRTPPDLLDTHSDDGASPEGAAIEEKVPRIKGGGGEEG